ncbi:MAG TPA: hypothetical protein DGT23_04465 [Micromonosporaceae bacterium]|nr:hypothetical protein [Micromonosporaceae bacterium]
MKIFDRLARLTPGPLMMRAVVFVSTAVGLWAASPAQFSSPRLLAPILVVALMPALAPDSRLVGLIMVLIVGAWLLSTLGFNEPAAVGRTFAVACALYLTHSSAALAAVLPHDAIVDTSVLLRWAARRALILTCAGIVTAVIVLLAPAMTPSTSFFALFAGLAVVAALLAVLARSARLRRRM